MQRYISLYLDVAPVTFDKMAENLNSEDWEQLRINAHSLKPQAEFMGAHDLKDQLVKIEEAVKTNSTDEILHLYNQANLYHLNATASLIEALKDLH